MNYPKFVRCLDCGQETPTRYLLHGCENCGSDDFDLSTFPKLQPSTPMSDPSLEDDNSNDDPDFLPDRETGRDPHEGESPSQNKNTCTICNLPIKLHDVFVGTGDGRGQNFAHYKCYESSFKDKEKPVVVDSARASLNLSHHFNICVALGLDPNNPPQRLSGSCFDYIVTGVENVEKITKRLGHNLTTNELSIVVGVLNYLYFKTLKYEH